jgi:hypothetical protein
VFAIKSCSSCQRTGAPRSNALVDPGAGFEPALADSESAVLPLDDPGMGSVFRLRGLKTKISRTTSRVVSSRGSFPKQLPRNKSKKAASGFVRGGFRGSKPTTFRPDYKSASSPLTVGTVGIGSQEMQLSCKARWLRRQVGSDWLVSFMIESPVVVTEFGDRASDARRGEKIQPKYDTRKLTISDALVKCVSEERHDTRARTPT